MTGGGYAGPGCIASAGLPAGSTRVVWIGPERDPWYGDDWIAIWLTSDDRSAVMMEGRRSTLTTTIIGRINADAACPLARVLRVGLERPFETWRLQWLRARLALARV